jgi:DNA-binding MarR family transcriptional regulator
MTHYSSEQRVDILRHGLVGLVRRDGPDLTARQLSVFLTTYLQDEAQTVSALAAELNVEKPVISRALDRLSEFDLVRRKKDTLDRRSVLVQRTTAGQGFLRDLERIVAGVPDGTGRAPSSAPHVGVIVMAV